MAARATVAKATVASAAIAALIGTYSGGGWARALPLGGGGEPDMGSDAGCYYITYADLGPSCKDGRSLQMVRIRAAASPKLGMRSSGHKE